MSNVRQRLRQRLRGPGAWRTWLGLGLLAALTGYAFYAILWKELATFNLAELFGRLSVGDISLALLVYTADLALAVLGWVLIIGPLSGYWRMLDHTRIYLLTSVTKRLPGTFWYILGRVVLYERLGVARGVSVLAGGLEFAVTIMGGLVVALAAWPVLIASTAFSPIWLLLPLAIGAALLNPPAIRAILRRLAPQHAAGVRYRHLLGWVLIYVLVWSVGGVLLFVLANAVYPLPLSALPGVIGVWATAGIAATVLFSVVPFGLGVNELTLTVLLGPFMPAGEAFFVALLMRALLTICEFAFALLGALLSLPLFTDAPLILERPDLQELHQDAEKPEGLVDSKALLPPK
jgi:hypothetical protein